MGINGKSFASSDVNDFYLYRLYGWGKDEHQRVFSTHGHDSIVTARPPLFQNVTIDWLRHHKIFLRKDAVVMDKEKFFTNSLKVSYRH